LVDLLLLLLHQGFRELLNPSKAVSTHTLINQPTNLGRRVLIGVWCGQHGDFSIIDLAHQILLLLIVLFDDVALPETLVVEGPHPSLLVLKLRKSAQMCRRLLTTRISWLKDLCEGLVTH
jgi:hypothetical protein